MRLFLCFLSIYLGIRVVFLGWVFLWRLRTVLDGIKRSLSLGIGLRRQRVVGLGIKRDILGIRIQLKDTKKKINFRKEKKEKKQVFLLTHFWIHFPLYS
ncbi:Hypothetical protein Minf_1465 [Methylacidiphilum infernorum V4]|uniref:Uncharacterized protein n=1 Tax=Methylacidiphilum infernorum (isolate V4) TaxID=481448 RepID=B3DW16_METI4|nr:Hypothetical protein Minf_1465 [Methylacidiphilum infernorum V4]